MNTLKILSLFAFSIFLVSAVSALMVVDAQFQDGSQNLQIEKGQSATFDVYFTTYDFPMNVSVKMYNSNNQLVHTFIDSSTEDYFFEHTYTITETAYEKLGDYEIRINGSDAAGDSDSVILNLKVVAKGADGGVDTTFPEITIYSPQYGKTYTSQIKELHYKIYDENIDSCEYSTDATRHNLDCKNGEDAYISVKSKSGTNTWTIYAKDKAGNTASRTIIFSVSIPAIDTTAPIITIVSPEDKKYSTSTINLKILTNEDADVWFKLDDKEKVKMNNPEDHIYINTLKVSDGEHKITFYAKDEAGNEASKVISFSVNTNTNKNNGNEATKNRYYEDELDREAYLKQFETPRVIDVGDEKTAGGKSSSAWIIWLIVGLIVLVVLIIIISMLRA